MTEIRQAVKSGLLLFLVLFIITGFAYPLAVTLIAGAAFPYQAHGSLIIDGQGQVIGSSLIGQNFSAPFYFQGRPSETPITAYNASSSGGSNLAPGNPLLLERIAERVRALRNTGVQGPLPSDLVMASGSGLDPDISLDAALVQVPAVAEARGLPEDEVRALVLARAESLPVPFVEPYVNVLSLNRELDRLDRRG
ncbi:Potassium-transporting ATPase C chain [Methanoculleus chikugoensis]|jgi:K+-transporting ATPase ATPase C chain|uniref:Potassium-transporting ATPase KdpC subunit n=1 Tax=Methanoculleus chikugoensis TaxID=118126 RepID=A0A1M4MJR7_9EURY|nr:potassium-transporting ATPase subunit KdpC [Methanoculleus chikugoensis]SCL75133.1 Potassium-transporting ATPase C chain [Methanoculleus chikugoensis]